ncbi:hypothetical protein FZI85_15060 [Mycobacterium sp. CBMA293]|nr:hypothetical protein [Mycolicibacterium sp. CBMA 360]MUL57490.1 hypothetical protein [Mycolicibacterium sp. CBMA 335]MUL70530.1 hypothetical protein [Mycolicibacterium sp. CBMA 311]MUL92578.1 hypothetical protein [Mycolicibacterium sp. CBMA 230]MUM04954.1 hypothetical protein [Mycolicibacterium sp. CBMA 213]MUM12339.1 hypothetical protein [Mycolicibacterium sp. CBMA 293]
MEPNGRHGRLIHMTRNLTADLPALHQLAAHYRDHSTELAAHAADLTAIAGQFTADALGPVGATFAAALAEATHHQAQLAHGLSAHLEAAGTTATATATRFADADRGVGSRVGAWI